MGRLRIVACSVDCIEYNPVSFCFSKWFFDDLSYLSPLDTPSLIDTVVLLGTGTWGQDSSVGVTASTSKDGWNSSFVPQPIGTEVELGVERRRGAFGRLSSVVVR